MLIERSIKTETGLLLWLSDHSEAFDKIRHKALVKLLTELDVDSIDLRILVNLYW